MVVMNWYKLEMTSRVGCIDFYEMDMKQRMQSSIYTYSDRSNRIINVTCEYIDAIVMQVYINEATQLQSPSYTGRNR